MPIAAGCRCATPRVTGIAGCRCRRATLTVLRRFWPTHRHPERLFPNRHAGLKGAHRATSPLDLGGVQITLRKVAADGGLKKR